MNNLNVKLAYSDIISFYFSFQSQPPAAFIQVRPEFTELFAKFIPSNDEHGKGFDPNSKGLKKNELKLIDIYIYLDEKRRRIVLCLKTLKPELEKTTISSIYYYLKAKSSTMVNAIFFESKILLFFCFNRIFVV
jgi:hypothetical protein